MRDGMDEFGGLDWMAVNEVETSAKFAVAILR
jgi:hypothetical protein